MSAAQPPSLPPRDEVPDWDGVTCGRKRAFLNAFCQHGVIKRAVDATPTSLSSVWRWRQKDEAFAAAYDEALSMAARTLESYVFERALAAEKPDTTAAIFLLKGWMPDRYRDTRENSPIQNRGHFTIITRDDPEVPDELVPEGHKKAKREESEKK